MAFRRKSSRPVSLLVVGLGNPGPEYARTRHNVGFMVADRVAERLGARAWRRDRKSQVAEVPRPGDSASSVLLVKPQTFMNLSGRAAAALLDKYYLPLDDMWLVYDELDLPFGKLRIRTGGRAGGHNGVASVIEEVGGQNFPRFRVGIGRPDDPDPVDHLLSKFTSEEKSRLPALLELAADAVIAALDEGIEISMNRYNGRSA
jgi:PTH1 family peptidyl-tRNA hydrolase